MQPFRRILPLSCLLALTALPAFSEGLYVEGNVGLLNAGDLSNAGDLEYDTFGLRGGYQFNPIWSVEADLQTGSGDEWIGIGDSNSYVKADLTATAAAFVRASAPLGEKASLHARLGYAFGEFDVSVDGTEASLIDVDFDGIAFGAGGSFDLTDKIYLRADYTQINDSNLTTNAVTFGAGFKF